MSFKYNRLLADYNLSVNNNKAYERLIDSVKNNDIVFKYTIDELKNSKDSVIQEMNKVRKELSIKNKQLNQIQYIQTISYAVDSFYMRDTIFKQYLKFDTTIFDDWHKIRLDLEYPSKIDIESSFKNDTYITTSTKKETIKTPSKFFFVRWFQKKQHVIEVNIIQKNPYTTNVEQRFIEVIK